MAERALPSRARLGPRRRSIRDPQFLARWTRLSKGAVFFPKPSNGVPENQGRRTSPQLQRSAQVVARRPRKPFPRIPDRNWMSQSDRYLLDAYIAWRRPSRARPALSGKRPGHRKRFPSVVDIRGSGTRRRERDRLEPL